MNLPGFTAYVRNPRQMPPYTAKAVPDRGPRRHLGLPADASASRLSAKDIPLLTQILNEK